MLIRWSPIRLIEGRLGLEMSGVVLLSCCVVFGLFMEVPWRGRGVLVMGVCGRGFWIVVAGGVMNGKFSLCFVYHKLMLSDDSL